MKGKREVSKLSKNAQLAYEVIKENPSITMPGVGAVLNVKHPVYGKQRAASQAIAELRRAGLIQDVARRCPYCHRALTRHQRNVSLYPTGMSDWEKNSRQEWLL